MAVFITLWLTSMGISAAIAFGKSRSIWRWLALSLAIGPLAILVGVVVKDRNWPPLLQ